jgi:hypothetical protein
VSPWIRVERPKAPADIGSTLTLRRETYVWLIFDANLFAGRFTRCSGLLIPITPSAMGRSISERPSMLWFNVKVVDRDGTVHTDICPSCHKRTEYRRGPPGILPPIINLQKNDGVLLPKEGKIRIVFTFSCYPQHQELLSYWCVYLSTFATC